MRTFVALNLPRAGREHLHEGLAAVRGRDLPLRWLPADNLHLTLKFLGDIEGSEVQRLEETLRRVAARHRPLRLQVGGLGAFPSLRRTSVLWIGVAPDPALLALQRETELELSRLGYVRELKPYRPHITVARTRTGARPPDVERLVNLCTVTADAEVESMELMRSRTGAGGSRYEPLLRIPLGPLQGE